MFEYFAGNRRKKWEVDLQLYSNLDTQLQGRNNVQKKSPLNITDANCIYDEEERLLSKVIETVAIP